MWDERYSTDEYAYGVHPNDFLRSQFVALPKGRILSLAEGEGRNAVFLAQQGYTVTAVDSSLVGLEKAQRLAQDNRVSIKCVHADLMEYDFGDSSWDGIISIFCPLPSKLRADVHRKVESGLRLGGVYLSESYTPNQLKYRTGGGDCTDTMQTKDSLLRELPNLEFSHLVEIEREVVEGTYHTGQASVVQAIGHRKS